jgi:HAD superfamily hydrolase (TIGR01549 family)
MKQTIFFDLGNVLIFFDHQKMCRQVAGLANLDPELIQKVMKTYGDPYERGAVDDCFIHQELNKLAKKEISFEALMRAISDIFEPNLEVIEIFQQIKAKGHRLFLLSNTCSAHFSFALSQFPFLTQFDGHVLSYEVGARKPEKKIYEKALEIAGCQNKECFYTDDIFDYVASARSIGIDAEQYTNPQALMKHLQERAIL